MAITETDIRDFFRDRPADNPKHLEEFFDKTDIALATRLAKSAAKTLPPNLDNFSGESTPDYIMLYGIASFLLEIKINNLAINTTPGVMEHGVQLSIGDELQALSALQNRYWNQFGQLLYRYKKTLDYKKAFGKIKSPYSRKTGSGYNS